MGRVCRESQEWVETQVEQPVITWENQQENRCRTEPCNPFLLCLNVVFCWVVLVLVRVTRIILVTVGKWVARVICETVNLPLDAGAFVINLVLSIPVLGGIIRTALNWGTELIWRVVGLVDVVASLAGIRPRKKMYLGVVVPSNLTTPAVTDADIQRQVDAAVAFYDSTCNINVIFTGICHTQIAAPSGGLVVSCDGFGFFNDWWIGGSYFELATSTCKFTDGFRRVIGVGAEIVIFIVDNVTPDGPAGNTNGCSFASTHNYVLIEAKPTDQAFTAAHEIGHACWLLHDSVDPNNLMNPITPSAGPVLTNVQIATVRGSRHCVYF